MKPYPRRLLGATLGLLLLAIPALAHHSATAEFDSSKTFTVKGTITNSSGSTRMSICMRM